MWKIWVVVTLTFITIRVHGDPCKMTTRPREAGEDFCTAEVDCSNYVEFQVSKWSCIRHVEQRRNYNYGYRMEQVETFDDNYNLIIKVSDPREEDVFNVEMNHFTQLTMENGELIAIPEEIYQMTKLTKLCISGTKISTLNLNYFRSMSFLNEINLANNMINVIDVTEKNDAQYTYLSKVQTLNLSRNFIKDLPNNFVSRFIQLLHLDLSYNMIDSIGLLTFEGIVQLKSLDISQNRLLELENAFARFINLQTLSVSNNNITKLLDYNFGSLTNLETLNASYNYINIIENNTFQSLTKLKVLDLGYNKIKIVSKKLLSNNANLNLLHLMNNSIQFIEANCFKDKNITDFNIQNNHLTGTLERDTFKGINVNELDLSRGDIKDIRDEAFTGMVDLLKLNLSSNSISNISDMAFSSFGSLKILDLSHNKLDELKFKSEGLQNLLKLYVHHNKIKKLRKTLFDSFLLLTELDLSYNEIIEIEPKSFSKLMHIKVMKFSQTHFVNTLHSEIFEGLISLQKIDISGTRTVTYKNNSFVGLLALSHINSSFGQLTTIEFNAFIGTGSLEVLILSNNQLHSFHVNSSTISKVQEIYLNNNLIENISSDTFSELRLLRKLHLGNNAIKQLGSNDFQYLNALMYLDLSSNTRMDIIGNPFQNLTKMYRLSLENIKSKISFENSSAFIEVLDMPLCGIANLNKMYIFNVRNVVYLNLSMNEIVSITKDTFGEMPSLVSLDLSFNKIVNIQPGSFLHIEKLIKLNLFENNLALIQYGVFDGTKTLKELNLSSNVLSNFDIKLIQSSVIEKIYLDDNIITNLSFIDFFESAISVLSIGGNQISCNVLAELKASKLSDKFNSIVTAKALNYHSENVNGIPCQTITDNRLFNAVLPSINNTGIYISPLVLSLKNAIEKLDKTLHVLSGNTNKTEDLRKEAHNAVNTFETFIKLSNTSQIVSNDYLNKLTNINNGSSIQLGEIKLFLMNLTKNLKDIESNIVPNIPRTIDDQNMRLFKTMLKQETDAIREEFRNVLASIHKGTEMPFHESLVNHNTDTDNTKVVFYFIAICLAVMLAAYLGNIVFSHVTRIKPSNSGHNHHNSVIPISNSIEME